MSFQKGLRTIRVSSPIIRSRTSTPTLPFLYPVASLHPSISTSPSRRHASNPAAAAAAQRKPRSPTSGFQTLPTKSVTIPLDATKPTPTLISSTLATKEALNPPASTRPPALELPVRDKATTAFTFLFKTGKAYVNFYKAGVRAIFTNRKLLREAEQNLQGKGVDDKTTVKSTRAATLLRERVRHDLVRLPIFGLMLLVCGEFTPLIVIVFPKLTPYTCRIPKQIDKLRFQAEERRRASFRALRHVDMSDAAVLDQVAPAHIVRSLGLGGSIWDKMGCSPPFSSVRAEKGIKRIVEDDFMIRQGGGVKQLEDEEVVLAAEDRGMDVPKKGAKELRETLANWIMKTTKADQKEGEATVRKLLCGLGDAKQ